MKHSKKIFQLWFPFTPSRIGIEETDIPRTHNRTFTLILAKIMQEQHWECQQVYLTNCKKPFDLDGQVRNKFFPVSFQRYISHQASSRQWSFRAIVEVLTHPPDLLAIFQAYGLFAKVLAFVARIKNIPYIVIVGGWYSQISRSQRWYFSHAFRVLVHTQMQKQALVDIGYSEGNIEIFPLGIDTKLFDQKSPEKYLPLDNWPRLLYVGRLQPSKGVFEALLTFDVVKKHYPQASIKIIGPCNDQPFLDRMKRYVQENNLEESVNFVGPIDYEQLPFYYQDADIFLFPSPYEGLPSVVLESMACGTPPVVIRGSGGTEEAVLHGKTGWVVDMPRLAYEVLQILADPAQIQSVGEQAVLCVHQVFSSQRTFDILCSLLAKISDD